VRSDIWGIAEADVEVGSGKDNIAIEVKITDFRH
jgi:hypothetical protein